MERPEEHLPLDLTARQFVDAYVGTLPSSTPEERKVAYKRYKERRALESTPSPRSSPRKSSSPPKERSSPPKERSSPSPTRRAAYGGLATATLTGLPRELQAHIASFLPLQATGRVQRVGRVTRKTSEERLREVCEAVPTLQEVERSGLYQRRLRGGQRVAFLDSATDTLYVSVFDKGGIQELHSRAATRTITPGLSRLAGDEALDILQGLYQRSPGLVPSLPLLERTLSRRKSCVAQGGNYLLRAVLHIVDVVSHPYLYPVVGMEFSELLVASESSSSAFQIPLVPGLDERADVSTLRWRVLLLKSWFNPYRVRATDIASAIQEMLSTFTLWAESVPEEYRA
jgi:hypothetical protein